MEEFDLTDKTIVYIVRKLASPRRGQVTGLLTTTLAKLLFLVDYWYFTATRKQLTRFRYVRYKFGPYPLHEFDARLSRLDGYEVVRLPQVTVIDERPYALFKPGIHPRFLPELPEHALKLVDDALYIFGSQSLDDILNYIYSLEVVKSTPFGEAIDLSKIPKPVDEEFALLSAVADEFSEELAQPVSKEHMRALEEASKEPTNENVELAKLMLRAQMTAYRLLNPTGS